jgi:hypothetical protein
MKKNLLVLALAAAASAMAGQAAAQAPAAAPESAATRLQATQVDRDTLVFNMESVAKLLETSSAARQIEATKSPDAWQKRDKAREAYKAAQAALAAGDLAKASQLLTEVRALFFEAVRLAAPEEVTAKKYENDYRMRLESVNALLGAYKRVANEKGSAIKGVNETVAQIEKSVAAAATLAETSKYREGRAELDRAYLVAKAGVSGLRSGDTLVRSLNFASKEEEYHYEIDRNNTHQMLIEVLASEKRGDAMIQGFITKAKDMRARAEAAVQAKDYATGVKLLEDSTAELVRAIRSAGIYIPG